MTGADLTILIALALLGEGAALLLGLGLARASGRR